jgi:formylglycine-generating enzyme required for sulfatase activity
MVRIPAGRFHYQDGKEDRELEAFWIDEYEVTIAAYAAFLDALADSPSLADSIDHADQPESKKGHVPPEWDECYGAARKGKFFKGQPVDLNCPVTLVDWWDAHAYAAWKGHRLPTEEEWEKAARGRAGNLYPWGDEFVASNLNSSRDYAEDASDENAGTYDGYVYWSPVDAIGADVSPYDVKGMAGNVSEWTASWTDHPEYPDRQVPVTRGGSFATRTGYELHLRRPANSPEEKSISLGFRTATSTRPEDAVIELD